MHKDANYNNYTCPISAFCQTLKSIKYALSLAPKEVKKNFSLSVVTSMAFGMIKAVLSLVIEVTSVQRKVTKVSHIKMFA